MSLKTGFSFVLIIAALSLVLTACAPEVGTDLRCEKTGPKPKGEWTANDATAYTKYCILGVKPGE